MSADVIHAAERFGRPAELFEPPGLERLCDLAAEQAALGTLLARPKLFDSLPEWFKAEYYADDEHRLIHETMAMLRAAGEEITEAGVTQALGTVSDELRVYIATLPGAMIFPSLLTEHLRVISRYWYRRRTATVAETLRQQAMAPDKGDAKALKRSIEAAMRELDNLASLEEAESRVLTTNNEALDQVFEAADQRRRGENRGITTGFPGLDRLIKPMLPGHVHVLAGRTSMGKSALALAIAVNVAKAGHRVGYLTLEMEAMELAVRELAMESGISTDTIQDGEWSLSQTEQLVGTRRRLHDMPINFLDQGTWSVARMRIQVAALKRLQGLDLLIIDHLHLVDKADASGRANPSTLVARICEGIKGMARDLQIPVLALAQLNREFKSREDKRPLLTDLKESGAIEELAQSVTLIHRPEMYLLPEPPERGKMSQDAHAEAVEAWELAWEKSRAVAELIVAKSRMGKLGMVKMRFHGETVSFRELDEYH
jgi:replicative DNA helicase